MIVAIDGPAGAGKSTVAKILAKRLGFLYIDTGAMYRALTLKVLENKIDIHDEDKINALALNSTIDLRNNPDGSLNIILDGKDVSLEIRQPRITQVVSDVSKIKWVRRYWLKCKESLGKKEIVF